MCHRVRFYKADKSVGHGFIWHFYLDPEETPEGEIAFRPVNRKARMKISVSLILKVANEILTTQRSLVEIDEWLIEITEIPAE